LSEKVRVLRMLEYVGDREWVEDTLNRSSVPLNGTSGKHTGKHNIIKSATLDQFPEILDKNEKKEEENMSKEFTDFLILLQTQSNAEDIHSLINKFFEDDLD